MVILVIILGASATICAVVLVRTLLKLLRVVHILRHPALRWEMSVPELLVVLCGPFGHIQFQVQHVVHAITRGGLPHGPLVARVVTDRTRHPRSQALRGHRLDIHRLEVHLFQHPIVLFFVPGSTLIDLTTLPSVSSVGKSAILHEAWVFTVESRLCI